MRYIRYIRYDLRSMINVQVFSGYLRKLACTKNQKCTDKAIEHNEAYSILAGFGLAYLRINRSSVNSVLSCLSSVNYTSPPFAPTSIFAFATATDRV